MPYISTIAGAFLNSTMRLVILPTEKCNYRCVYCYEDFEIGNMSAAVSDRVKLFLEHRIPELRDLEISWFGGEPLLAIRIVEDIMLFARKVCAQLGVQLTSGVTTNAHLLNLSTFLRLFDLRLTHYQVTLDGSRRFHDQRRRQRTGDGAYDHILNNLRAMCSTSKDFSLSLRTHLDELNAEHLDEFISELEGIASDPRVSISFERVKNLGRSLPSSIRPLSEIRFREIVNDFVEKYKFSGIVFDDVTRKSKDHVCYAALPNNYVIRADGRIQKCTVALEHE